MQDHKDGIRVAESTIVVLRLGNANGAKGRQIERVQRGNNVRTQRRRKDMVNKTGAYRQASSNW